MSTDPLAGTMPGAITALANARVPDEVGGGGKGRVPETAFKFLSGGKGWTFPAVVNDKVTYGC